MWALGCGAALERVRGEPLFDPRASAAMRLRSLETWLGHRVSFPVRAPVAQWIERRPPEPKVAGSNPVGRASATFTGSTSAIPWAHADGVSLTDTIFPRSGRDRRPHGLP